MSLLRKPSQNFTENTPGSHAASPPPRSTPCPSATLMLRRLLFGLCVGTPHSKGGGDVRGTPYSRATSEPRPPNRRPPTAETAGATSEHPPNISNNILRTPNAQSPNRRPPAAENLRTSTLDTSGAHLAHQHFPPRPRAHSRWHQACDQARDLCRQRRALETP